MDYQPKTYEFDQSFATLERIDKIIRYIHDTVANPNYTKLFKTYLYSFIAEVEPLLRTEFQEQSQQKRKELKETKGWDDLYEVFLWYMYKSHQEGLLMRKAENYMQTVKDVVSKKSGD